MYIRCLGKIRTYVGEPGEVNVRVGDSSPLVQFNARGLKEEREKWCDSEACVHERHLVKHDADGRLPASHFLLISV